MGHTDRISLAAEPVPGLSRLLDAKLTPRITLVFFVALALICAAAAGIGYVTQNLRHAEAHRS